MGSADSQCAMSVPPWLIIGGLNLILSQDEKRGGEPIDSREVEFATNLIQQDEMLDLGFTGNEFTYSNGRTEMPISNKELIGEWPIPSEFSIFHIIILNTYPASNPITTQL